MVSYYMGDERSPIVMGGVHGVTVEREEKNPVEFLTVDGQTHSQVDSAWLPPLGNEVPKDVFGDSADGDTHPTRTVWQKSFKGHTILVEDRDGHEFLRIIDRAGQVIEMDCPVTEEANSNNGEQRGVRNSVDDNQVSQSSLVNGRGYIRLKDVAGQELILDGKTNSEEIRIVSRNRQGSTSQQVVISSAKGREKIQLLDKGGNTVTIDPNAEKSITVADAAGNEISFSSEDGLARYIAANGVEETVASQKSVTINGKLEEVVGGDRDISVLGNALLSAINDLSANVGGMTSAVLSGAFQLQVVNAPADGTPKDYGSDINVAIGHARTKTEAGNNELEATIGDVNLLPTAVGGTVNAGSRTPVDSAALESKVQTELNRIRGDLALLRDEVGRILIPMGEFPFPLLFADILEIFPQPLLYTVAGQSPINIRTAAEAGLNNAPVTLTTSPGTYPVDPIALPPGQSGVLSPPTDPSPTQSDRLKTDS